jgi:hypothetical protein
MCTCVLALSMVTSSMLFLWLTNVSLLQQFCGSTFSSNCKLDPKTIYQCDGAGATPKPLDQCKDQCIVQAGGAICSAPPDKCKCPISSTGKPVCGGTLDPSCKADPTAIYYCPNGDGSDPQILKQCIPGTQCNTDKDGNANCGYATCNCTGNVVSCSNQYPDKCNLVPNSVYKCDRNGAPVLVKTCSNAEECVSFADGATCVPKNCKCPRDGFVCGDIFPPSCLIPASTIYNCKRGEDPVFYKDCKPGTCSSSVAALQAEAVFGDAKCIDACKCDSQGKVCAPVLLLSQWFLLQ